jgi:hypothetical protein
MRKTWSALLVLLLTAGTAKAQVVPLPDLTQALLRERIQLFLQTAEARALLNPIARFARLRANQIVWAVEAGRPVRLVWEFEATRELTELERLAVQEVLRGVLRQVFGTYRGGLLSETDMTAAFGVARFGPPAVPLPQPEMQPEMQPQPQPQPQPATPPSSSGGRSSAAAPSQAATMWYYPSGCYPFGYYPGWYYYGWCYPSWYYPWWGYSYSWTYPAYYYSYPVIASAPAPAVAVASASSSPRVSPPRDDLAREILLIRSRKATDPERLYRQARTYYWQGDSEAALVLLTRAIALNAQDARFWYFRALAERSLGDETAARESAERGAALEMLRKPNIAVVGLDLERVQGADRWFLRHAVETPLTPARAAEIARAPLPSKRLPSAAETKIASTQGR